MKYTPGPWWPSQEKDFVYSSHSAEIETICNVESANEANTRLLAAGPELLEALICLATEIKEHYPEVELHPDLKIQIDSAIAKATGGGE